MPFYSAGFRRTIDEVQFERLLEGGADDASKPNYESEAYRELKDDLEFVRAVYGGTKTMREKRDKMLPQLAREDEDDYLHRLNNAVGYNAYQRTVAGLVGMVFRKDITVSGDLVESVQDDLQDVDRTGKNITSFARNLAHSIWRDGWAWIHVDAPDSVGETIEEQRIRGDRPYWVPIEARDAINWDWEYRNGKAVLTLFVYRERATIPSGEYGSVSVTRYRVLRPGSWEIWEEVQTPGQNSKARFALIAEGSTGVDEVPVVFCPSVEGDPFMAEPPLRDIAYLQVRHYRRDSLYDHALDYAVPMPVITGQNAEAIEWGANRALFLPDPDSQATLLEMRGSALNANRQQLMDIKADMAQLGLSMLVKETRAAETAEAKRLDRSGQDSILAAFAASFEDALNMALWHHGRYRGQDVGPALGLNRDYVAEGMDPQLLQTLVTMVQLGQIRLETVWAIMVQGEVLPENFDAELEATLLGETVPG